MPVAFLTQQEARRPYIMQCWYDRRGFTLAPGRQGSLSLGSGDLPGLSVTLISAQPPPAAIDLVEIKSTVETRTGFCMILQKTLTLEVYFMLFQKALCCLCRPNGFDPRESVFADVVLYQNCWVIHHFLLASSYSESGSLRMLESIPAVEWKVSASLWRKVWAG